MQHLIMPTLSPNRNNYSAESNILKVQRQSDRLSKSDDFLFLRVFFFVIEISKVESKSIQTLTFLVLTLPGICLELRLDSGLA